MLLTPKTGKYLIIKTPNKLIWLQNDKIHNLKGSNSKRYKVKKLGNSSSPIPKTLNTSSSSKLSFFKPPQRTLEAKISQILDRVELSNYEQQVEIKKLEWLRKIQEENESIITKKDQPDLADILKQKKRELRMKQRTIERENKKIIDRYTTREGYIPYTHKVSNAYLFIV